jgi:hypothetical protein
MIFSEQNFLIFLASFCLGSLLALAFPYMFARAYRCLNSLCYMLCLKLVSKKEVENDNNA